METKGRYSLMKDSHLKAVHDDDLKSLLCSLGYYEKVCSGQCQCHFCAQTISMDNLGAIIPLDGKITFSCDSTSCLRNLAQGGDSDVHQ